MQITSDVVVAVALATSDVVAAVAPAKSEDMPNRTLKIGM